MKHFSEEEIERAKDVDLCQLAQEMGFHVKRRGMTHYLEEMDSLVIFNRRTWSRFSDHTGGNAINFIMWQKGLSFTEAVTELLERSGIQTQTLPERKESERLSSQKKEFLLPAAAKCTNRIEAYLTKERGITPETVQLFERRQLIYEDWRHNVVFVGRDAKGIAKHASLRGTYATGGAPFKGDVAGSDKRYSFNWYNPESHTVVFAEAPIDIMSYVDLTGDRESSLVALNGTAPAALSRFLRDHPQVDTALGFMDRDGAGARGIRRIAQELRVNGVEIYDARDTGGWEKMYAKDVNEYLQNAKDSASYEKARAEKEQELAKIRSFGYDENEALAISRLFTYTPERFRDRAEVLKEKPFVLTALSEYRKALESGMKEEDAALAVTDDCFHPTAFFRYREAERGKGPATAGRSASRPVRGARC